MRAKFLHMLPDAKDLFRVVAQEHNLLPGIIEKDYWLMHCLWGIQQQGYSFELKGGTSLSKGFNLIERFSEDIDIQIHPAKTDDVKIGKNHDKPNHIESRKLFFDKVVSNLSVSGLTFTRDHNFDDLNKMRNAGIRAEYISNFDNIPGLKEGMLLELGFDQTAPNESRDITSWAFEKAKSLNISVINNRAKQILCYYPEYTFVEKLQTLSTKYRLQQEQKTLPINFLRHYYDVYKLLESKRVLNFIGTDEYKAHKERRFRVADEKNISKNPAFSIPDPKTRTAYSKAFKEKSSLYFGAQPSFDEILERMQKLIELDLALL